MISVKNVVMINFSHVLGIKIREKIFTLCSKRMSFFKGIRLGTF